MRASRVDSYVRKPFNVSADWIVYAHGPGAESGQPAAIELCALADDARSGPAQVPGERDDLVREIISVAELYSGGRLVDEEDRRRSRRATRVINRARRG